jgi:predicted nucleotidyltransferase
MSETAEIVRVVLAHYPAVQAIYLFGTYGTADERPDRDVDIALLLPPQEAKAVGLLVFSELRFVLQERLQREVDLINLRRVTTVLQKEVIAAERPIYLGNHYAMMEFEMLTLSYYQKLNEERAEIIQDALVTGRLVC